jgi:hypothetical protein
MKETLQDNGEAETYSDEKNSDESPAAEELTAVSTQTAVPQELVPPKSEGGSRSRNWFIHGKKDGQPKYDESLFKAIHRTFFTRIWTAGVLKLVSGEALLHCLCSRI